MNSRTDSAKLALLAELDTAKSISALSDATGYSPIRVRRVVHDLADKGLVTKHKTGREIEVQAASKPISSKARSLLNEFPDQEWGRVLHGDRALVLHVLDQVGRLRPTAGVVGQTPRGVGYTAKSLAERGILVREDSEYRLHPRHHVLGEFLEEYVRVRAHHIVGELDPDARVIWYLGPEVLFRSDEADLARDDLQLAALSAFPTFGVDLVTQAHHYILSRRELGVADAILQGLLVEPGNRINRSYCALVYEKTLPDDLVRKARIYDLEDEARRLRAYVRERKAFEGFLPWEEHERYRDQYGVA